MNALLIHEQGGIWSLRTKGAVFPVFEGKPKEVVRYVRQRFTGQDSVEIRHEDNRVEKTQVSVLIRS